jgi:hypothetical protein
VTEAQGPRELDDDEVARTIRAMERQFARWRRPPLGDVFLVAMAVVAMAVAIVVAPQLVETAHAGWAGARF